MCIYMQIKIAKKNCIGTTAFKSKINFRLFVCLFLVSS